MTDYILNGWEGTGNWTLSDAAFIVGNTLLDCQINGYGERSLITQNANWIFRYIQAIYGDEYGEAVLNNIYLYGDSIPLIFGVEYSLDLDLYKYFI